MEAKWWQKLTLPLAKWVKNQPIRKHHVEFLNRMTIISIVHINIILTDAEFTYIIMLRSFFFCDNHDNWKGRSKLGYDDLIWPCFKRAPIWKWNIVKIIEQEFLHTWIIHSMRYSCAIGSLQLTACSNTPGKTTCQKQVQIQIL